MHELEFGFLFGAAVGVMIFPTIQWLESILEIRYKPKKKED